MKNLLFIIGHETMRWTAIKAVAIIASISTAAKLYDSQISIISCVGLGLGAYCAIGFFAVLSFGLISIEEDLQRKSNKHNNQKQ